MCFHQVHSTARFAKSATFIDYEARESGAFDHSGPEISISGILATRFIPEGLVWLNIAKTYKIGYVNEVLRVYYVNDHATGATLTQRRTLTRMR